MPCRSDYMEPRSAERESKKVAQLLIWLAEKTQAFDVKNWVTRAANNPYGNEVELHTMTADLCYWCGKTDEDIIYNGRDSMARKLADWYDEHLKGEERRAEEDAEEARREQVACDALAKLTEFERECLGI